MNFKIPLKTLQINFKNSNIYELIGKIKLIKEIISNLSDEEIKANKNEFIAYSESLDNLLDEIDEVLQKHYLKELNELFKNINDLIELIGDKLGEYPIKSIKLYPAEKISYNQKETISFDEALKELV